jgi:L,D-transpeptidase catalytic domain
MLRLALFALFAPFALAACGQSGETASDAAPPSAVASSAPEASAPPPASEDDAPAPLPKLSTAQFSAKIYENPNFDARPLGYMRAGQIVERHPDPYEGRDAQPCGGKWYRVEPAGYVCTGHEGVTLDLDDPRVTIPAKYPPKDEPLPYGYGMSYSTPMYARVPTPDEQNNAEGDVAYWRKTIAARREQTPPDKLTPEFALPLEEMPEHLRDRAMSPAILPWLVGVKNVKGGYALPNTRLAFLTMFESEGRNFYLTTEHLIVPADRFKAARTSDFRGVELAAATEPGEHLPMVWVRLPSDKFPAPVYALEGGALTKTDVVLAQQSHFAIATEDVMVHGVRHHALAALPPGLQARDGVQYVVRQTDVTRLDPVKAPPDGVGADEAWIDVDISRETLVLYRGAVPTFATLVSSGVGGPKKFTSQGTFHIYQKHISTRMSNDEKPPEKEGDAAEHAYRFDDVPWVQYVFNGIALHAAFWHDGFGQQRSHGCVNLSPRDARYLFGKTLPRVPDGWHGVDAARGASPQGSVVVIHS